MSERGGLLRTLRKTALTATAAVQKAKFEVTDGQRVEVWLGLDPIASEGAVVDIIPQSQSVPKTVAQLRSEGIALSKGDFVVEPFEGLPGHPKSFTVAYCRHSAASADVSLFIRLAYYSLSEGVKNGS